MRRIVVPKRYSRRNELARHGGSPRRPSLDVLARLQPCGVIEAEAELLCALPHCFCQ
jgi:hypothetical protein